MTNDKGPVPKSRWLLLFLVLLAFARVTIALDMKNLWWDESLSLQRAESGWEALLTGALYITDTFTQVLTVDQHPFFFFVVLGVLVRLAGTSEFVLRFPSVMAVTLLVPTAWAMARLLVRRDVLPPSAPLWSALLMTASPFFLWYGQEARPYALWAWLALFSTYLLLRATEPRPDPTGGRATVRVKVKRWPWWLGYTIAFLPYLTTHYFAVFLLPLHILFIGGWIFRRSRWLAVLVTLIIVAGVGMFALLAAYLLLTTSSGVNFRSVPLGTLLIDLLNAFSMGLSVDIGVRAVWWLDLLYGAVALLAVGWALRSWRSIRAGGWLLPALIAVPIAMLLLVSTVHPAYMNARHMSLLGGPFALLLGGGLAVVGLRQRWVAGALALLLLAGAGYSTVNYFTNPAYSQKYDDFSGLGRLLERRLVPGDLVILHPAAAWRIFDYYLPIELLAQEDESPTVEGALPPATQYGAPLLIDLSVEEPTYENTFAKLQESSGRYRRIWFVYSGTHPHFDPENRVQGWLEEHLYKVQRYTVYSHSELRAHLFIPEPPVFNEPIPVEGTPLDVVFGEQIRLIGYDVGTPIVPESAIPVTLYWRTGSQTDVHYKYILQLTETLPDGSVRVLATTEREPYEGAIATVFWHPQQTIVEYTELPGFDERAAAEPGNAQQIRIQLYRADTLEKQPITSAQLDEAPGGTVGPDGVTLVLPYVPKQNQ